MWIRDGAEQLLMGTAMEMKPPACPLGRIQGIWGTSTQAPAAPLACNHRSLCHKPQLRHLPH